MMKFVDEWIKLKSLLTDLEKTPRRNGEMWGNEEKVSLGLAWFLCLRAKEMDIGL